MQNSTNLKTVVYTSHSPLRDPKKMIKEMWADLKSSFYLGWRLAARDIAAQYRQTAFGYVWAVLPPFVTTFIWVFLNSTNIVNVTDTDIPYPVYAFFGTILWQLFLDSLNAPLKQMNLNRAMLTKINHPKEALIVSGLIQVAVSLIIKFIVLTGVLIAYNISLNGIYTSGIIIPLFGLVMLGTLFGILLVPIGMLYKDIQEGIPIFAAVFMYFAPVVYTIPTEGIMKTIFLINPLTPLVLSARSFLYGNITDYLQYSLLIMAITLILLHFAWILYRLALPLLIERMES